MPSFNLVKVFSAKYQAESFEIRKKVTTLFWICSMSVLLLLLLFAVNLFGVLKQNPGIHIVYAVYLAGSLAALIFLYRKRYTLASALNLLSLQLAMFLFVLIGHESLSADYLFPLSGMMLLVLIHSSVLFSKMVFQVIIMLASISYYAVFSLVLFSRDMIATARDLESLLLSASILVAGGLIFLITSRTTQSIKQELGSQRSEALARTEKMEHFVGEIREGIAAMVSISEEMHATVEEQSSATTEQASGITEVSATLEELSITAKQITTNTGELVLVSGEATKLLEEGQTELRQMVQRLEEVGNISRNNANQVTELGKRSSLINNMVEIIKDVANTTNMLSINASIEASRAGESGKGFSVVAAEIRELSKETILSAKKVETAAREIQEFIDTIIIATESESDKVLQNGKVARKLNENLATIVQKISGNYDFSQKIDLSIKQQETGSRQAAETMRQMAEIAKQSSVASRQTGETAGNIVELSNHLEKAVLDFSNQPEPGQSPGNQPRQ